MDRAGKIRRGAPQRPPLIVPVDSLFWEGYLDDVPHLHVGKLCAWRPGRLMPCDMREETP